MKKPKKKEIYDLTNPKQLDSLYKKNSQLLSRLSGVAQENEILETELNSALKEKTKKDVKNVVLVSRVKTLKEQVSLFARQQKEFNQQSRTLRDELKKLKIVSYQPGKEINIAKKQNQLASKKLIKYIAYRKRVKKAHALLKQKIQNLEDHNSELLEKTNNLEKQIQNNESGKFNYQKLDGLVKTLKVQQEEILQELETAQKENSVLKINYENLRKSFSHQEEGFKQTMMGFQKRYSNNQNKLKQTQEQLRRKERKYSDLEIMMDEMEKGFERQKQDFNKKLKKEINYTKETLVKQNGKEVSRLVVQLNDQINRNQDLENQLHRNKTQQSEKMLKQRGDLVKEISELKSTIELQNLNHEKDKAESLESLKSEYETKINNLTGSFDRKLQHVQTEMDNDFLSERKRSEIFKTIKEKQVQELKQGLEQLQKESHQHKTSHFALEKSNKETLAKLKTQIAKNKQLEEQNKNINQLWHEMQQTLEKRNAQLQSLQKLNKELSQSLAQDNSHNNYEEKKGIFKKSGLKFITEESSQKTDTKESKDSKKVTQTLADIHFD